MQEADHAGALRDQQTVLVLGLRQHGRGPPGPRPPPSMPARRRGVSSLPEPSDSISCRVRIAEPPSWRARYATPRSTVSMSAVENSDLPAEEARRRILWMLVPEKLNERGEQVEPLRRQRLTTPTTSPAIRGIVVCQATGSTQVSGSVRSGMTPRAGWMVGQRPSCPTQTTPGDEGDLLCVSKRGTRSLSPTAPPSSAGPTA